MTPDLNLDEFSHGRCTASTGVNRQGRCAQGAISPLNIELDEHPEAALSKERRHDR